MMRVIILFMTGIKRFVYEVDHLVLTRASVSVFWSFFRHLVMETTGSGVGDPVMVNCY